jgi:hypothetical protein
MGSSPEQNTNGEASLSRKTMPYLSYCSYKLDCILTFLMILDLGYTPTIRVSEPWTVDKALDAIPDQPPTETESPIPFFHMLERLKTTKREGWRRFAIDR